MTKVNAIQLFENNKVRTVWDKELQKWFISIIDVIEILTESDRPRKYWSDLKAKLKKEGSELSENIGQLKMKSSDGKFYKTDVAKQGGNVANVARKELEDKTGKKVVTSENAKMLLNAKKNDEIE